MPGELREVQLRMSAPSDSHCRVATPRLGSGEGSGGPGPSREGGVTARFGGGRSGAGPERLWLMCNWEQMALRGGSVRAVRGRSAPRSAAPFPRGDGAEGPRSPLRYLLSKYCALRFTTRLYLGRPEGPSVPGSVRNPPSAPISPSLPLFAQLNSSKKKNKSIYTYRHIHAINRSVGRLYGGSDTHHLPHRPARLCLLCGNSALLCGLMRSSEPSGPPPSSPLPLRPPAQLGSLRLCSARFGSEGTEPTHFTPPLKSPPFPPSSRVPFGIAL